MANIQRSPAQWQGLIQKHANSQLSVSEFCSKHKLSSSIFYHWRKRLNTESHPPFENTDNWQAVKPTQPDIELSSNSSQSWDIELSLPNGVTLKMRR